MCCIKITIFFPTNFSQSLLPNEIIFVTYRNYIFPFNFRSIQTAIFLLKISSSRIIKKEIKERSSITIIHIILDRNNFSFDTIKFWKKRKKKKKKWKATQDRDANLQPYFFFFFLLFLIVVGSTVYYAVFTEWRERVEKERERGEGPVLTARLTKARPPVKLIAHKMKRLFLWRWGRPITGVGRGVQRRGTGAFSAIS